MDGMLVHHRVPSMKRLGALLLAHGWDASPSQGTQHEATRSITTPPGWDASPSQGTQHEATRSITTPPGWDASPSQCTQHEATRSITTPPGWDTSPSQGHLQQFVRSSNGLLYTPGSRENLEQALLSMAETTRYMQWSGLGLPTLRSSERQSDALTNYATAPPWFSDERHGVAETIVHACCLDTVF